MLKSEIAIEQLHQAVKLYNRKKFIPALTLAGSANEILSGFAIKSKGFSSLDEDKTFWDSIAQICNVNKPSKDKVIKSNNKIRNILKHNDNGIDEKIIADFNFECEFQIDSAIRNYIIAFEKFPNIRLLKIYWERNL